MSEITWNPKQPNIRVRMRNNPGKQGVTTGETLESAGRLLDLLQIRLRVG
jgi:hypothetical protein